MSTDQLDRRRFVALWRRAAGREGSNAESVFADVDRRYGEDHRRYHDRAHIIHCLEQIDEVAGQVSEAVELAIWFHDAIYTPGADDNEARSAELFREHAEGVMSEALIERVVNLIMITTHRREPRSEEEQLTVDIDLSSFGLPWNGFKRDSDAVRAELHHLTDKDFSQGSHRFLEGLLGRSRIFHTSLFRDRFEASARSNIERQLEFLRDKARAS